MRDDDVRSSCFASLDVLVAQHGGDVPYRAGSIRDFLSRESRAVPQPPERDLPGCRPARAGGALDRHFVQVALRRAEVPEGILYAYRAGPIDQPEPGASRDARVAGPFAYFVATRPGWYKPLYPCFALVDDVGARRVLIAPGSDGGAVRRAHAVLLEDEGERRYAVREVRVRMHQARFRGRILLAYDTRCAICSSRKPTSRRGAHRRRSRRAGEPLVPERAQPLLDPSPSLRPGSRRRLPRLRGSRLAASAARTTTDRCSSC